MNKYTCCHCNIEFNATILRKNNDGIVYHSCPYCGKDINGNFKVNKLEDNLRGIIKMVPNIKNYNKKGSKSKIKDMEVSQWFVIDIGGVDMLMCKCAPEDNNCFSYCFNATMGGWSDMNCNLSAWIVENIDINFGYKTYTDTERLDAVEKVILRNINKSIMFNLNPKETLRSIIDKDILNKQ